MSIEEHGRVAGLCKIVPPTEWRDLVRASQVKDELSLIQAKSERQSMEFPYIKEKIKVTKPIQQSFSGENGVYFQLNMVLHRSFSLEDFKKMTDSHVPNLALKSAASKKEKHADHRESSTAALNKNENESGDQNCLPTAAHPDGRDSKRSKLQPQSRSIEYSEENLHALESLYWKTLIFNHTFYGADMLGSLFPASLATWNLKKLPCLLNELGTTVHGVNTPYLYFGAWKSTFAWHVEDMDLFSINFLHFGAPKQWYSVPQRQILEFEGFMRSSFPEESKKCGQFLRHKTFVASPQALLKRGIMVNKVTQFPGEFVVTFPFGYHQGYNYGFNCAEAVNFALPSWIESAFKAKVCTCINDAVQINPLELLQKVLEGREKYPAITEQRLQDLRELYESQKGAISLGMRSQVPGSLLDGPRTEGHPAALAIKIKIKAPERCMACLSSDGPLINLDCSILAQRVKVHPSCAYLLPLTCKLSEKPLTCTICKCKKPYQADALFYACTQAKCPRVGHMSCLLSQGVQLSSMHDDPRKAGEDHHWRQVVCEGHRPEAIAERKQQLAKRLADRIKGLVVGSRVIVNLDVLRRKGPYSKHGLGTEALAPLETFQQRSKSNYDDLHIGVIRQVRGESSQNPCFLVSAATFCSWVSHRALTLYDPRDAYHESILTNRRPNVENLMYTRISNSKEETMKSKASISSILGSPKNYNDADGNFEKEKNDDPADDDLKVVEAKEPSCQSIKTHIVP